MTKRTFLSLAALLAAGLAVPAGAADGEALLTQQCASCHALQKPSGDAFAHVTGRGGPDLHYAGSKFKRDWLVEWLHSPTPIRPGGRYFVEIAKPATPRDTLDTAALPKHPALGKAEAEAVAAALMAKTAPDLIPPGGFAGGEANKRLAQMSFTKLRGCVACHQSAPGEGGLSGAELFTAGKRLNPDYVAAFIRDPQKIDPRTWMPSQPITDPDIQKLTAWLATLGNPGDKP